MDDKPQFTISASAIQAAIFAFLRYIAVLATAWTAIAGFVSKGDLTGAIVYVQSEDFLAVIAAVIALGTMGYGLYKTFLHRKALVDVKNSPETIVPDSVLTVKGKPSGDVPPLVSILPVLFVVAGALVLASCTTAGDIRLNANKAFSTGQLALKSAQQSVLAACAPTMPSRPVRACDEAIDLLHTGAQAEAAGFTAQQAGNQADLAAAVQTLVALPAQLVALGVLEKN